MSAAETATPVTAADNQPKAIASSPSGDGAEDAPKPSAGLSPSTWKPNADAAEWKPSFGGGNSATAQTPAPAAGGSEPTGHAGDEEGKHQMNATGKTSPAVVGDHAGENAALKEDIDPRAANGGDATGDKDEGSPSAETTGGAQESGGGEEEEDADSNQESRGGKRYEIDFLLKLRPKPEGTPKPAGLNPPARVDILWDGKEAVPPKAGGSIRSGVRPLPPLGGRMGLSKGLGEARGAPPPLRGAQQYMGRDRDSRMDPRGGSGGGGGGRDDRRSGGSGGRDRGGEARGRRPPVDTAPALEDCKPIEVNEATRWKPKSLESKGSDANADAAKLSVEEVLMKANAILNKMTLEKFNKLSVAFMNVGLRDPEVVAGVIDMIVEKAQMEHHFSSMYADLCERIARTPIPGLGEDKTGKDSSKGSKKFRKMLLVKCQEEFEKDWQGLFTDVQKNPDLADDEKAEKEFGLKRKYTGHMRFVGELYKVELLREKHVHAAIHDMFGNADEPDEERLECMVKLLQTCGKKLDQTGSPETAKDMKRLFKRIGKLADTRQVSSRIRFMLRDLIELRKNHWVPRREEEKAKTMQELHNDIAKEEESKNRASGRGGGGSRGAGGVGSSSSSSSLRPGSGDARLSSGSRPDSSSSTTRPTSQVAPKAKDEDGWEVVPKKGGKGAGSADGWSQVPASRSRTSNPGSDERRGGGSGGGGGAGGPVAQQSAFALLSSRDDEKEKKKKKKDSKDKKDKEKSSKSRDKKKSKSTKTTAASGSSSTSAARPTTPSSATPGADDVPPVPPPAAAAAAGAASAAGMSEETARKKGKDVVAEYAVSGELSEACTCLSEIDDAVRWAAVAEALSDSMERKQKHRDALAVVLAAGAKDGSLSKEALMKGIHDVLELVPDVCIDVPQAATYVASAVAPLCLGGYLSLGSLVASPCEGLLEGGKAAEFAVVALAEVKAAAVADGLSEGDAAARASELLAGALDLPKLAAMLPFICRGEESKATALLERKGVSL